MAFVAARYDMLVRMFRGMVLTLTWSAVLLRADIQKPLLPQNPTLNRTHIVFSYAGDLWKVPRDGGEAVRLTSGIGVESEPYFSPDGALIAFTGEYDGNVDVFVVPESGGVPKRLTYHPGTDRAAGWTSDGKRYCCVRRGTTIHEGTSCS